MAEECPGHLMLYTVSVAPDLEGLKSFVFQMFYKCVRAHITPPSAPRQGFPAHKCEHSIFLSAAHMYYSFVIDEWPPGQGEIKL